MDLKGEPVSINGKQLLVGAVVPARAQCLVLIILLNTIVQNRSSLINSPIGKRKNSTITVTVGTFPRLKSILLRLQTIDPHYKVSLSNRNSTN